MSENEQYTLRIICGSQRPVLYPGFTGLGHGTLTAGVSAGGEISGGAAAEAFHYNGTA